MFLQQSAKKGTHDRCETLKLFRKENKHECKR
jgi:hypothetical protein